MTNYIKFILLTTLGINVIGNPVLAVEELQSKPSNSEEQITESTVEKERATTENLKETDVIENIEEVFDTQEIQETEASELVAESEEKDEEAKAEADKKVVRDGEEMVEVTDWDDFVLKLGDLTVERIKLTDDLVATSKVSISHDVVVEGAGHTIDFAKNNIVVPQNRQFTIGNVNLVSSGTSAAESMFTSIGAGKLIFTDKVETNAAPVANLPKGTVEFLNSESDISGNETLPTIVAKALVTTGGSINVTAPLFYQTSTADSNIASVGTKWEFNIQTDKAIKGKMWDVKAAATVHFDSESIINLDFALSDTASDYSWFGAVKNNTILIEAPMNGTTSNGKVFQLAGTTTNLTFSGKASKSEITDAADTFLKTTAIGIKFSLINGAELKYTMSAQREKTSYAIWASAGGLTTELSGASIFNIQKLSGNANAVNLEKNNNNISISEGSDYIIYNKGEGGLGGQSDKYNHAMMFEGATNKTQVSTIELKDRDSTFDISADLGTALTSIFVTHTFNVGAGTYFIARANPTLVSGAIRSYGMTFNVDDVAYLDIKHRGGGKVINTSLKNFFSINGTDLALWRKDTDVDTHPSSFWEKPQLEITGAALEVVSSSNNSELQSEIESQSGLFNYSRLSLNNQIPNVAEIRVPTDADKRVFARVTVPQGKREEHRPAYEKEVTLKIAEIDPKGKIVQSGTGVSKGYDFTAYKEDGKNTQDGIVEVEFPDFLTKGNTVKVIEGYRGTSADTDEILLEENMLPEETVRDITPPTEKLTIENSDEISAKTEMITGKMSEPGYVTVYSPDKTKKSETVATDSDGIFEVPMVTGMSSGDSVFVSGKDKADKQQGILNPPVTNDEQGNEQPIEAFTYHDRQFETATEIVLQGGEVTLKSAPQAIDFGNNKISSFALNLKPSFDKDLIVEDTRRDGSREEWTLTLRVTQPLMNGSATKDLTSGLSYTTRNKEKFMLNESDIIVEQTTHEKEGDLNLSEQWDKGEGFNLNVPIENQIVDEFTGKFGWTLLKGVENKED